MSSFDGSGGPRWEVEMHPYQDEGIEFLRVVPRSAFWVDMGLGKTVMVWSLIKELLAKDEIRRVLVLAPLKVATQTWPNETREWRHLLKMKFTLIRSDDRAVRMQLLQSKTRVHIINREMFPWLVEQWRQAKKWPYDMVVIDDTSFKDHTTNRFKHMKLVRRFFKRIIWMTASPAAESFMGLFAQFYILDGGERFGNSITAFRLRYFDHDVYKKTYKLKEGMREEIMQKIAPITLVMREEDHLDIKKPNMLKRKLQMTPNEMRAYKKFERTLIIEMPNGEEIEALTAAALSQKLLQAASGAIYNEAKVAVPFHEHKIEDLATLIEELDGSPIMVPYWFKSSRDRLMKAFPKATLMDRTGKAVGPWNEGKIPVLFVHPQSAGHGLNMQYGPGHDIYMFDMFWSGELYQQVIKRVARQGQKKVVRVHHPLMIGTHDEDAMASQESKGAEEAALKAAVLRIRKRIIGR